MEEVTELEQQQQPTTELSVQSSDSATQLIMVDETPRMTYEDFITKHQLKLDLTWKGFTVRDAGKNGNAWPCFQWIYEVRRQTPHSSSLTLRGNYTQGLGNGRLDDKWENRGSVRYDSKVGLYFRLFSGGCYKLLNQGQEAAPASAQRPWFIFEHPDTRRLFGPKFYVNRPTFPDILDSLRSDAECAYPTFEEFAAELGYDSDSRSAEKIYLACCEIERKLLGILGRKGLVELLEEVERL